MLDQGGLHWVQVVGCTQALDGRDVGAFMHDRERQTRVDAPSLDDHRAGAALTVIAALFAACQMQMLAQRVEQRGSRIAREIT